MKKDIHPKIYTDTKVTCVCGNSFVTISTVPSIQLEICSNCHPFFTGQHKFVDTEGRIDKFIKKAKVVENKKTAEKAVKATKKAKNIQETHEETQVSLKEMLKKLRDEETQSETKPVESTTPTTTE